MPLVFPMALSACKERADILRISGTTMGTTYSVVAIDKSQRLAESDVRAAIEQTLDDVDFRMSNWRTDSEVSRFNAQTGADAVAVSPELEEVMQAAEQVHLASEGRFDITMGPLIELWGFGASDADKIVPSQTDIAAQQARSGHLNSLQIETGALRKTHPDAHVFLAGIGKGYGADLVGRSLETLGIEDYFVEIGGDLYARGRNPNGLPWQIGIESPDQADRGVFGVVGLSSMGLATSGDYRNYFETDGQRFSHLLDPATGYPVTHVTASATVVAENAMLADAWSTAMLILGRERGLEVASAHDVAVQFIERNTDVDQPAFDTYVSSAFKALTT